MAAGEPTPSDGRTTVTAGFPTRHLPQPEVRDLPAEPRRYWPLIGPGIIAAGVGLASGEFILFPYIASQIGLVFVWAALVGLLTQFVLNMEIERYTLATVVYVALERAQMLKVAAVVLLFLVGAVFAIGADAWADLPQVVTNPGI